MSRVQARETRIVEDTTQLIDYTSRVLGAIEGGNWRYAGDKIPALRDVLDRLAREVDLAEHAAELRQIKGDVVWSRVAVYAGDYWLGRVIFAVPAKSRPTVSPNDPVDVLGLSTRVRNCLRRNSAHTIADLVARDEEELRDIRNFGPGCMAELRAALVAHGLKLRDEEEVQTP